MGDLIYVGGKEIRKYMLELGSESKFKGKCLIAYTSEELENRLYEAAGIILVGYQDKVFAEDKRKYANLVMRINQRLIPLAAVLNPEQKLPYDNEGLEFITWQKGEDKIPKVAASLDHFFAKYITDYFDEKKGQ